ncbi:hypothetical protein JCM10207_009085 [Rhodosporidiobolus poonsookiae]
MRLAWVNPEATSLSLRRYRSKFCLLYLLWAYSPSFSPSNGVVKPSSAPGPFLAVANSTAAEGSALAPTPVDGQKTGGTAARIAVTRELAPRRVLDEAPSAQDSPLTPAYDPSAAAQLSENNEGEKTTMPVKGSTSRGANASMGCGSTPALSEPPAPLESGAGVPAAEESFHPSDDAAEDSARPETAEPPPRHFTFTFTPLTLTLLLLHLLFLTQRLSLSAGDAIAHALLSTPLATLFPSTYSSNSSSPPPTGPAPSWSKRLLAAKWRVGVVWRSCGPALLLLSLLTLAVIGGVAVDLVFLASRKGRRLEGWNAAPFAELMGEERLKVAQGFGGTKAAAWGWSGAVSPWRCVVGLEVLSTLLVLIQAASPLLTRLGLLPSSVPVPTFLRASAPPPPPPPSRRTFLSSTMTLTPDSSLAAPPAPAPLALLIPLPVLLPTLLRLTLTSLALAQTLCVFLARFADPSHPPWRRWLSFSSFVFLNGVIAPLDALVAAREAATAEVGRVEGVVRDFGVEVGGGGGEGEKEKEDDEEWVCSVCFEGQEQDRPGWKGWKTPCRLPCRHRFHATCLASWFATQSFCPTCHAVVSAPPPSPSSSSSTSTSVLATATHRVNPAGVFARLDAGTDNFPGAAAAARREGARRRTVAVHAGAALGVAEEEGEAEWEDLNE